MYAGQSVTLTLTDSGIAELVLDTHEASVNVLNAHLQDELGQALAALGTQANVQGLLIRSAKPAFVLGADITEFTELFGLSAADISRWAGKVHGLFNTIEKLPYPTVAAVNGMALGGGMELALSADFRIADTSARLGFPEVTLGICPGWGGTVRLSRLVGAEAALGWILSGKPVKAAQAQQQGALDSVVDGDQLLDSARALLQEAIAGERDYLANRHRKQEALENNAETAAAMANLQQTLGKKLDPRYPAAPAILAIITAAMTEDFYKAQAMEAQIFGELASGVEAKNLVGLFLNDQYLKRETKRWAKQAHLVGKAAVLGAGIMGGGIGYQAALNGTPMLMKDINQEALDLGISHAGSILDRSISKGRMTEAGKEAILAAIHPTLTYEGFTDVDYVVEAVVERVDVKRAVLAEVEHKVSENTIVATNTSTISIDLLAESLQRPDKFCGMHFFNPVHAMKLVEVIRGSQTSDDTIATTVAFAASMGKTPIVVNDCPGFLVNRVLFPYFNGFNRLLMDGVDFERIDQVMEQFGWPMGPAYLADVIGLDTMVHADKVLEDGFPERMGHDDRPIIETLLEQGALGQKNGVGFYEYGTDEHGKRYKRRSEKVATILSQRVTRSTEITDAEIIERMMIPMCLETARCLEESIVASATEADMGLILGLGFPRFRGGALRYIDNLGAAVFAAQVETHAECGPLYELTDGIKAMVANGNTFY
ncbi:fatty acid oxidation complex subunit alpha FadB [Oceanobacter sp. 3_MG-2023]|uniref:fatty acid oxidation complex subunit alpha FadB n=1 Tax=Oceanobacter sp. 3_MG-2023 TaxID=3062622 RepID=UPI00273734ED|nr:fatty acid oxidation complex subunit alpha FadB [Oceanobacter sp. 3_MG-2023]MDP2505116.1 fatty acid oxidation complex subunit alpha FadB [Oceanobacter sp. 3_MG-2023]